MEKYTLRFHFVDNLVTVTGQRQYAIDDYRSRIENGEAFTVASSDGVKYTINTPMLNFMEVYPDLV